MCRALCPLQTKKKKRDAEDTNGVKAGADVEMNGAAEEAKPKKKVSAPPDAASALALWFHWL